MNSINIVFITDNGFAVLTGVAIYSLKKHANPNIKYNINIICNNVDQNYILNFKKLKSKNFYIKIVKVDGKKYEDLKKDNLHVSTTALFKFDLPNIFPNLDKILYIDGDVLIQSDLCDLYKTDISDFYAGVCIDYGGLTFPMPFNKRLKIKNKYYFNSGMLLLNLKKLRNDDIPKKLIDYRINKNNFYMDQDAFNVIFKEKVKYLSFKYNFIITCWRDFGENILTDFYKLPKKEKRVDYLLDAEIIHFASADKPNKYIDVPLSSVWYEYYINSTFKNVNIERIYLKKIKPDHVYFQNPELETEDTLKIDKPLISVIIPVYNASNYIKRTMLSVTTQSLKDIEIICVDDGSTDNSVNKLIEYANNDKRISIYRQKNQYAGVARNNGILKAKGDYIVFLDSDDKLENDALIKMYKKAISTNSDIVITSAYFLNDITKKVTPADFCLRTSFLPAKEVFNANDIPKYIFNITGGNPWAKMFKRTFIIEHDIKFLPIKRSEDFYFVCLSLVKAKRISVIKDRLFFYRINNSNSLESTKDETPLIFWDANMILYKHLIDNDIFEKYKQSFLNDSLTRMVYNLKQVRSLESFNKIFNILKTEGEKIFKFNEKSDNYWYFKSHIDYINILIKYKNVLDLINGLIKENQTCKNSFPSKKRKIPNKKPKITFKQKIKLAKKRGLVYCLIRLFRGRSSADQYLTKKGLW